MLSIPSPLAFITAAIADKKNDVASLLCGAFFFSLLGAVSYAFAIIPLPVVATWHAGMIVGFVWFLVTLCWSHGYFLTWSVGQGDGNSIFAKSFSMPPSLLKLSFFLVWETGVWLVIAGILIIRTQLWQDNGLFIGGFTIAAGAALVLVLYPKYLLAGTLLSIEDLPARVAMVRSSQVIGQHRTAVAIHTLVLLFLVIVLYFVFQTMTTVVINILFFFVGFTLLGVSEIVGSQAFNHAMTMLSMAYVLMFFHCIHAFSTVYLRLLTQSINKVTGNAIVQTEQSQNSPVSTSPARS
jgi:hypothetical protein